MKAIIVSVKDPAGMNIRDKLIRLHGFSRGQEIFRSNEVYEKGDIRLFTVPEHSIDCEHIDKEIGADLIVFATKHQSEKKVHSLSVHAPGNWGPADMGGSAGRLSVAAASFMKDAFRLLNEVDNSRYEVTLEATHHGPLIDTPCCFVEIGSGVEQWVDDDSGKVVAGAIMDALAGDTAYPTALFLGGGHYNHEANKVLLRSKYAIGHICPKHMLGFLDSGMLDQAVMRCGSDVSLIILDWKGCGREKARILGLIEKKGMKKERSRDIR